jgi:hypothetical protein
MNYRLDKGAKRITPVTEAMLWVLVLGTALVVLYLMKYHFDYIVLGGR